MSLNEKVGLTLIVGWILGLVGWVANIVQIFSTMPETLSGATPLFIAKAVCVFIAPIGAILGWVGMF